MKNSLLPIAMLLLSTVLALWLIRGGAERGEGGPLVLPGIHKLPQRQDRMTPSATIDATTTVLAGDGTASRPPADGSTWRVLVVAGDDNAPLTRATMLALAEEFTRRGGIAILDPVDRKDEPLPLGCDGTLRLATAEATLPIGKPGPVTGRLSIRVVPTRLPLGHPAARWLPAQPPAAPVSWRADHRSNPTAETSWPSWYAAVGRSVAGALFQALGIPETLSDTTQVVHRMAWRTLAAAGPGTPEAPGYGRIPSPPQGDVMIDPVAFQHPLVRGWLGRLSPVPVTARDGGSRTSREELIRRLERGGWTKGPAEGLLTYSKEDQTPAGPVTRSISLANDGTVVEWQERPHPVEVLQGWKTAAAAGDAEAVLQLERHAATPGLPRL